MAFLSEVEQLSGAGAVEIRPSDELRPGWDFSGAVEDVQLFFLLGTQVARTKELPRWNKGDEFEAPRLQALEALKTEGAR